MQLLKKRRNGKTTLDSPVDQKSIDREGGSTEVVEAISQQELYEHLDQLNSQFQEFDKIRVGLSTTISSIMAIVPRLNESKYLLQKEMDKNRNVVQQLDRQVSKLKQQKELLLQSIPPKQYQKTRLERQIRLEQDKVKEIKKLIIKCTRERKKIDNITQKKQAEIGKIDEYIKQIKSIREYGLDLVSTLVYASKSEAVI